MQEEGTHDSLAESGGLYSALVCVPCLLTDYGGCLACAGWGSWSLSCVQVRRQFNKTASSASLATSAAGSYASLPTLAPLVPMSSAQTPL